MRNVCDETPTTSVVICAIVYQPNTSDTRSHDRERDDVTVAPAARRVARRRPRSADDDADLGRARPGNDDTGNASTLVAVLESDPPGGRSVVRHRVTEPERRRPDDGRRHRRGRSAGR